VGSVAVMTGRFFTYVYRPRDPGTYMFHCHVEDTEHVHMGMTGPVFVRPLQNKTGNSAGAPIARVKGGGATAPMGYAYNDGVALTDPRSTAYDREFAMFCSEVWGDSHWADAHIQLPEWTDYRADFSLLNGRVYPDTLAPNGSVDPFNPVRDVGGDLIAPPGRPELQYQPLSALVTCNAGDRVLLRFANLGFREAAMTLSGIKMKVVGKDATPMKGRDGTDSSYMASTVSFGAGESIDAIFTAPPHSGGTGYDTYMLYDRAYERTNSLGGGGRRTEIRVYPTGTVGPQAFPNDWAI
jgi:FtsP/CotA-like multicopper oxidase with cupredoxin domain